MSSPEVDAEGIKWLFAHGTRIKQAQSRDNPGDHRWSHDTPGAGKGYEVTWIISPTGVTPGTGGSAGHTALKHGGPNHSGDCGPGTHYTEGGECCCWYDIGIRANGDLQFQIERPHPDNSDFDPGGAALFDNVGHEMEGNDTGLKIVAYPQKTGGTADDGGIHIKFYINSNALTNGVPNNNWRLAADIFDTGQILGNYDWPDYQELEVRNSDTDESGFYKDSLYIRMLTDADLQELRTGNPGGGSPPPPGPPSPTGAGAVVNTTWPLNDSLEYNETDAENVIKDTLNRQQLPVVGVDFLNTLYCVIGPIDQELRTRVPTAGTGTGTGTNPINRVGVQRVELNITLNTVTSGSGITARQLFDLVASEEMIEVQTDPFFDGWSAPAGGAEEEGQIGDAPCDFEDLGDPRIDGYSDGFFVEGYWSNRHNGCVIPGIVEDDNGNSTRVTYHGGRIMKTPKIILIFWGPTWESRTSTPTKTQLINDIRDKLLGTDSVFFSELDQYGGIGVPIWGGAYQNNNFLPSDSGDALEGGYDGDPGIDAIFMVVEDCFARGIIPVSNIDFDNTEFIVISEFGREDPNQEFAGVHTWGTIGVDFGSGTPATSTFPIVGGRHDNFKPTITIPGTPGGPPPPGAPPPPPTPPTPDPGGGVLPPQGLPPPGASTISPIVSWAMIEVLDPSISIIHSQLPDWDGNNTITRPLAAVLVNSQTDTDPFARFGSSAYNRGPFVNNEVGDAPCTSGVTVDNVHIYSDALGVQAYWSNLANNCVVPGRGDPDLGTSTAITYHGGRILKNPLVVLIFWGPGWLTATGVPSVSSITAEVKDKLLDNDKVFFSQLGQYGGVGAPQYGASVINTNVAFPADHNITTTMAMAVVKSTLENGSLPTALIDFNNTWFCVIPDYISRVFHPVTNAQIGYWNDVFKPIIVIPGTGPEDPGGSPDPGDLQTFSGVLSFKRDINMARTNTCAGVIVPPPPPPPPTPPGSPPPPPPPPVDPPPPPGSGGTAIFYQVTSTDNEKEISNESSSDDRTRIMQRITGSSSPMKGKILKQADVLLRRESGTNDVTPLIYCKIWNANNNVVYTSPTTFTPAELSTSFVGKTFDCTTNTHAFVVGDKVGIEFTGTDPDEFIWTAYTTGSGTGTAASSSQYKEGSSYDDQTSRNMSMTLWQ